MRKSKIRMSEFKTSPLKIMKELGQMIEDSKDEPDDQYFDDRLYWMKKHYHQEKDTYKSNKVEDKRTVMEYDLQTLNILINQILRFGRIVMSTDEGHIFNFPEFEYPKFVFDIHDKKTNTIRTNMKETSI